MTQVAYTGPIEMLRELERAGALTATSLDLEGAPVSYETYEALASFLGAVGRSHCWWVGDLINWGERMFGEEAAQAVDMLGLAPGTMVNYAYTCRQVARSRRRQDLSFAHHRVVAPLTPGEQTAWLTRAAEDGWRRSQLEAEVNAARPPEQLPRVALEVMAGAHDPAMVLPPEPVVDDPETTQRKVMEVVEALAAFEGELGHSYRCFVTEGEERRVECVCGLDRLEAAVAALGMEW